MYSIYTLKDPATNDIRYVGYTINPQKRLIDHISKLNGRKGEWIRSLMEKHLVPDLEIVEEVEDLHTASIQEIKWIIKMLKDGKDLLNRSCDDPPKAIALLTIKLRELEGKPANDTNGEPIPTG